MKKISSNITFRVTSQNISAINEIEKIAEEKNEQFTTAMVKILRIGLKFYGDGYREVDGELIRLPSSLKE